jgi:hypothetical protein
MDTSKAGRLIAEQMDALERDYGEKDGYEIGAMITIVEIAGPRGSHFRMRSNIGNPAMALGVMRMAEDEWLRSMRTPGAIQGGDHQGEGEGEGEEQGGEDEGYQGP